MNNFDVLKKHNYVRVASTGVYWFDLTYDKFEQYRLITKKQFNVIIYSKKNRDDYYVIPFKAIQNVFLEKYLSKSNTGRKKRWIATIKDNNLKVNNCPITINIAKFYQSPLPIEVPNGRAFSELLKISTDDINAYSGEEVTEGFEGTVKGRLVNYYERKPKLRARAIQVHGTVCIACGFDFYLNYGEHGKEYIEVHHLKPLSTHNKSHLVNPTTDMTVLCSNCHRMVHRSKNRPLSINELVELLKNAHH